MTIQRDAIIIFGLIFSIILFQAMGLIPNSDFILASFPTYYHKTEKIVIAIALILSLLVLASGLKSARRYASIAIATLFFYSCVGIVFNLFKDMPVSIRVIYVAGNLAVTIMLFFLSWSAFRGGVIKWKELFYSLIFNNAAVIYLLVHMIK